MRTYRELFAVAEFTPLLVAVSARYAAGTMEGIALGTLVYVRTGSPLLSALSMFGPSAAQVVGAFTLLSFADRVRPRTALSANALIFAILTLVTAVPGLSTWAVLVAVFASGLVSAYGSGIQWGLMREIVPPDGYLLGRSAYTMANGVMQIAGFALGGVLVAATSPRVTLVIAAAVFAVSAALTRFGLRDRPPRATDRASIRTTVRDNRLLWSMPQRRCVYLAMWVPNGLIVGCEALFVPYSTRWSGLLFSASALGMLSGDLLVGRVLSPAKRGRFAAPLRVLLAAPYLVFGLPLPLGIAATIVAIASVGYAAGLLLQEQLIALVPDELTGHAMGLHSSGMLSMQAVGATIAGLLARELSVGASMAVLAVASLAVTAALTPGLRRTEATVATSARPVEAAVG